MIEMEMGLEAGYRHPLMLLTLGQLYLMAGQGDPDLLPVTLDQVLANKEGSAILTAFEEKYGPSQTIDWQARGGTTHHWEEAALFADRIAFICNGRIIGVDTPDRFMTHYLKCDKKYCVPKSVNIKPLEKMATCVQDEHDYVIYPEDERATVQELAKQTVAYSVSSISLKDIYIHLIQEK